MLYAVTIDVGVGSLLLYGLPFIVVVGWLSGRMLGVRRGWVRAFVAGLAGWTFGVTLAALVQDHDILSGSDFGDVAALSFFFGVLISMFVSLALELTLKPRPDRRRRFRPILHPMVTVKRKLAPLGRSREILRFARKPGLTGLRSASAAKLATPDYARRIRLTLEDCGGMFVKFGQIASTRNDLLPEALTTEPAHLQASARPVPADEVRVVVESELGATVEVVFAAIGMTGLLSSAVLLLASGAVGSEQEGVRDALQVLGFFGLIVASVIEMRAVAQPLRDASDGARDRRV